MNPAWPQGDPRDVARSIIADPRFALGAPSRPAAPSWFDLLRDQLSGIARGLLHGIDRALGANSSFEVAIGFGVLAAAFGLLGWGMYVLVGSWVRSLGERGRSNPATLPDGIAEADSCALRAAAQAAALGGRYREAAGLLFLAVLRELDEHGRIAYDAARTPGEYRRLVRDSRFDALAADAVVAVFAPAEPTADVFARMSGEYERFIEAPGP
jgi:hypothetical protein